MSESGGDQKVPPVGLRQGDRIVEPVHPPCANHQGGALDPRGNAPRGTGQAWTANLGKQSHHLVLLACTEQAPDMAANKGRELFH